MSPREILAEALVSLRAHALRSFLAMLGIIVGVASMIVLLSLVRGAQHEILRQIQDLGSNLLIVRPGLLGSGGILSGNQRNLEIEDVRSVEEAVPGARAAPVLRGMVQLRRLGRTSRSLLVGTSPEYAWVRNFALERGRMFSGSETDAGARVAILGPVPARSLFGAADPVGETVQINGVSFRVVGVFRPKGDQGWFNPDDQIVIPHGNAMRQIFGVPYLHEIHVRVPDGTDFPRAMAALSVNLRERHQLRPGTPDDFYVRNISEIRDMAASVGSIFTNLLGGALAISMLIGGIGIMNIMLVNVRERTREIGIRKAVGARNRDILRQFLLEAVAMSLAGGAAGAALGIGAVGALPRALPFSARVEPWTVILALVSSAAVGIFFGYYPARSAARLNPVDALRHES